MGSATDSWTATSHWKSTWDVSPVTVADKNKKKTFGLGGDNNIPQENPQNATFDFFGSGALFSMSFKDNHDSSAWTRPSPNSSPNKKTSLAEEEKANNLEDELSRQTLYKTELCRSFVDTGLCRYGSKCQFAHGAHELRPLSRHPKYKTEVCKNFATTGQCPYGARCRFIHPGAVRLGNTWTNTWNASPESIAPFKTAELSVEDFENENRMKRLAFFQNLAN